MQASKKIIINMLLVAIFSFSFGTTFLFADEVSEIREMTKEKVDHVIITLKDDKLNNEEKFIPKQEDASARKSFGESPRCL